MTTATEIKQRFPNPIPCPGPEHDDVGYCVGGACVQYAGGYENFPSAVRLADHLRYLNPCLEAGQANNFAYFIISANDCGLIETAWQAVDLALSQGGHSAPGYLRFLEVINERT